ncbi:MAG: murein L,D-transpeptidase family protein [Rhizobiaceae bacterium]
MLAGTSLLKIALFGGVILSLSACQGALDGISQKANAPVPKRLITKMKAQGMSVTSPIMLRIFKQENTLEVWKRKDTGRYALLTTHEICKWSGKLGPKFKEGDRQAPEGFYRVNKHQMNPNSQYHLSFNMGFPNAYDRSHGRTGSHLMVHGACSSAGCYSMTDDRVEEIYALARDAFKGGQKAFQIQAYPFHLTAKNMVKQRSHPQFKFWQMLKRGYDHFEITKVPPKVDVCGKRYEFNTESSKRYPSSGLCPPRKMPLRLANAYLKQQNTYATRFEDLLAKAEGRKAAALSPLSYTSLLPGVTITDPNLVKPAPTVTTTSATERTTSPTDALATKTPLSTDKSVPKIKPAG